VVGAKLLNIAVFVFWIVAVTFVFTWVFDNTQGSVLIAILLHGTMDVFPNTLLLPHLPAAATMTSAGVLKMYWALALGFGVSAVLLVILTRGRLGAKRPWSSRP
jgi:hypothetical protein